MTANAPASPIHLPPACTGLLLSGGLDSAILLGQMLEQGLVVHPFYVRAGLAWESTELAAASRWLEHWHRPTLRSLVVFEMPLADVYPDHWSITGENTPAHDSPDEAVYLPARNALLLVKPALYCQRQGISQLALAPLGTSPFADAKHEYLQQFVDALLAGTESSLTVLVPLAACSKREVMALGRDYPLALTFSCISPRKDRHCGRCNKCAERQAAFRDAGLTDPTEYAASTR